LAEAEEENAAVHGEIEVLLVEDVASAPTKEKRKGKSKELRESESEKEILRSEKRKFKEVEEASEKPLKLKSSRSALQPIDSNGEFHSFPRVVPG
jgi:hypothetical protein